MVEDKNPITKMVEEYNPTSYLDNVDEKSPLSSPFSQTPVSPTSRSPVSPGDSPRSGASLKSETQKESHKKTSHTVSPSSATSLPSSESGYFGDPVTLRNRVLDNGNNNSNDGNNNLDVNSAKVLNHLDSFNVNDLELIEEKLISNFKILAQEFNNSRIRRADEYISIIGDLKMRFRLEKLKFNDYLDEISPTRNEVYNTEKENAITDGGSSHFEFPAIPKFDDLPIFAEDFKQSLLPYTTALERVIKKYKYDFDNTELQKHDNIKLIWQQYYKNRIDTRDAIKEKLELEIQRLESQLYNISSYKGRTNKDENAIVSRKAYQEGSVKAEARYYKMAKRMRKRLLNPVDPEEAYNDLQKIAMLQQHNSTHQGFLSDVLKADSERQHKRTKYEKDYQ